MTKDEIVTSLRCCISTDLDCCKTCPAAQEDGCEDAIKVYAADLIENQQREIEALRQANSALRERQLIRARWVDGKCSNCGVDIPTDDLHDVIFGNECHYCYFCGAKMQETPE